MRNLLLPTSGSSGRFEYFGSAIPFQFGSIAQRNSLSIARLSISRLTARNLVKLTIIQTFHIESRATRIRCRYQAVMGARCHEFPIGVKVQWTFNAFPSLWTLPDLGMTSRHRADLKTGLPIKCSLLDSVGQIYFRYNATIGKKSISGRITVARVK